MEAFQNEVSARLAVIRDITSLLTHIHQLRLNTSGNVRQNYTEVLRNELYRMMREIDEYKVVICNQLADIDTEAIMNTSRFPNMAISRQTTSG
jgi:hypothetical protein